MKRLLLALALAGPASLLWSTSARAAPEAGSFAGSGGAQFFGFEIDHAGTLTGSVLSSFSGSSGYDITSVSVDGVALVDLLPAVGDDYFAFNLSLLPGVHTISVKGTSYGGSFVGSYAITPVPEPAALALVGAGLGLLAAARFIHARRARAGAQRPRG